MTTTSKMRIHETENGISVAIGCPTEEVLVAMSLISRFKTKNNLNFRLEVIHDFMIEERGLYYHDEKIDKKNKNHITVYINPDNCENVTDDSDFCHGHTKDITVFGVLIHEFAHALSLQVYDIFNDYVKIFPDKRLYLNDYSNNCIHDEVAELVTLYLTNPYLLKLISKPHWKFMTSYFRSPIHQSSIQCFKIYKEFPIKCKQYLLDKWSIAYNYDTKEFTTAKGNTIHI